MKVRIIHFKHLSTECWFVQAWGLRYCETCMHKRARDCGGKRIRETGKNVLGKKVPVEWEGKMAIIDSLCLPYFQENRASVFLPDGRKIKIPMIQFQDITLEGGRFYQFYTYQRGGAEWKREDGYAPSP